MICMRYTSVVASLLLGLLFVCAGFGEEVRKPRNDLYGDPMPSGAVARLGTTRFRHASSVRAVAYSPDGRLLATGALDDTIRLWQAASGKELFHFKLKSGAGAFPVSVAFSPDGTLLAGSKIQEGRIHLWDTTSGKERTVLKIPEVQNATALTFSPDGSRLAAICWRYERGQWQTGIRFWEVKTGKEVQGFDAPARITWSIAFSPDGKSLAVAQEGEVYLCDATTGRKLRTLHRDLSRIAVVAFSRDGIIASASDGIKEEKLVHLWDAATGRSKQVLRGHTQYVSSLSFSADGKRLVSASSDEGTFRVWDVVKGELLRSHQKLPGIGYGCAVLSPDGTTVAEGSFQDICALRLWEVATGKEIVPATGHVFPVGFVAFLPHGKVVTSGANDRGDTGLRIWEARSGKQLADIHTENVQIKRMALSPNRRTVAVSQWDHTVRLWDLDSDKETRRFAGGGGSAVPFLNFTPDGKALSVSGAMWDLRSGTPLRDRQPPSVRELFSYSADGTKAAVLTRPPRLLDARTNEELGEFESVKMRDAIWPPLTFSPDGSLLAAPYYPHGFVVWDVATRALLGYFAQEGESVCAVAFSPDGRLLACRKGDGAVEMWETMTWSLVGKWQGTPGFSPAIAFSDDGRLLASGHGDGTVLIWDVPRLWSVSQGEMALTQERLEDLWRQLGSEESKTAYRAISVLSQVPTETLPLLRRRVHPARPDAVRSVSRLIDELDSDSFEVREQATGELAARGAVARPALRAALAAHPSPEGRRRIEGILEKLPSVKAPRIWTAEQRRALRSIAVLEEIGTPEARRILEMLAGGAASPETRAAKGAWERLQRR